MTGFVDNFSWYIMVLLFTTVLREMKMKPQTVPVAVKLPLDVRNRLKAVAENQDRSIHWLMREAVNQFLEREEQKAALRAAADESWSHYQETGLHVTLDEANLWMDSVIEGDAAKDLKCHK